MKRLLAALGCVAMLCVIAFSPADAIVFRERRVHWIQTQFPPLPPRDAIVRTDAAVHLLTAQPIDTTDWIPLWEGFSYNNTVVSLIDTIGSAFLDIFPCPGAATSGGTTADTVSITVQASVDGFSPVAVTSTWGPQGLETSSNNSFIFRLSPGRSAVIGGTAPNEVQLGGFRFVRFIMAHDLGGCFEAVWRFQSAENWTPDPPGWK